MRMVKLMADYECFPLWEASPGQVGNINPDELPISAGLRSKLAQWAAEYDATLNRDDPAQSGFPTDEAKAEFKRTGTELGEQLKSELGSNFSVFVKV